MQFGLFDHLDARAEPPARLYADRLALIRSAEQAGFRAYHLAEHHGTPLGLAPSPGIFLAAVARETRRVRLGPMVYCLPLYQPLRLLEEICMLDHLSDGRLEVGVGRGVSPLEAALFGIDPAESVDRYIEALDVLRRGLSMPILDFKGRFYRHENVELPLRPLQPSIPFWSAAATPDALRFAAAAGMNLMTGGDDQRVRGAASAFAELIAGCTPRPLIGASRLVHVADTDVAAESRARPAYRHWHGQLAWLWRKRGVDHPLLAVDTYERAAELGMAIAGSPGRVRDALHRQVSGCGYDYPVLQFAFGNLGHAAEMSSLALFAERVMPDFGC